MKEVFTFERKYCMTQENCKFLATDFETSRGKGKISLSDRYCVHFFFN